MLMIILDWWLNHHQSMKIFSLKPASDLYLFFVYLRNLGLFTEFGFIYGIWVHVYKSEHYPGPLLVPIELRSPVLLGFESQNSMTLDKLKIHVHTYWIQFDNILKRATLAKALVGVKLGDALSINELGDILIIHSSYCSNHGHLNHGITTIWVPIELYPSVGWAYTCFDIFTPPAPPIRVVSQRHGVKLGDADSPSISVTYTILIIHCSNHGHLNHGITTIKVPIEMHPSVGWAHMHMLWYWHIKWIPNNDISYISWGILKQPWLNWQPVRFDQHIMSHHWIWSVLKAMFEAWQRES